ncbi:hypothetical protein [uncultured Roseobacter sp.]|uniref:hypothetical protein n=1 Tax=uncultured Roseobacter sp. TaxID=114847 RepID=UPI00263A171E|nr:hypothetical protein [uncultured Roseobacter sp.]
MIGGLVVEILSAAAAVVAKGAVGAFAKSGGEAAFDALKKRLAEKNGMTTLDLLDRLETSPQLKQALAAELEESGAVDDAQTLKLVEELRQHLESLPSEQRPYAIEGGSFKSGRDIIAQHVEGLRDVKMEAEGNIDVSGARSPGK